MMNDKRQSFIDRTARKPYGEKAVRNYNDPKAHYKGFRIILEKLNLAAEDTYFEIGCGGGVLLHQAASIVTRAAAIDHSEDMVALARKNNSQFINEGKVEIVVGDVGKLPWDDNSFTTGASANMFFFVEEPEKALAEVYRVLKPGGRFALVTLGNGMFARITFGCFYSLRTYSDKKMTKMFVNAGFATVNVRTRFGWTQVCYAEK